MWRQLSGSEKRRFVVWVIGLLATVLGTILNTMEHRWVHAALQAFLAFLFSYSLYKLAAGEGEPQPDTINPGNASDNSFTVTVPPNWRTSNQPHAKEFVLLLTHDPRGSMDVHADAASSTLQELGKSAMDAVVNRLKAVIDPGGSLQPTTVDGEAALRCSYTVPLSAEAYSGAHGQSYYVQHRNVEYIINVLGETDEHTSDHADFDAIMHSWKWST